METKQTPIGHRRRTPLLGVNLLGAAGLGLAMLLFATPAIACSPPPAVFQPGDWVAWDIFGTQQLDDGTSDIYTSEQGGFTLNVDGTGTVTDGSMVLYGGGFIDSYAEGTELGEAEAQWTFRGELSGYSSQIAASGNVEMELLGRVDVSGTEDINVLGLPATSGFQGTMNYSREFNFSPQEANCNTVFGDLRGGFAPDSDDQGGGHLYWIAYRVGNSDSDVKDAFADLSADAEELLAQEYPDPDQIAALVAELVGLNALLSGPDYCEDVPDDMAPGSPLFAYARTLLTKVMDKFLGAAVNGYYDTKVVIDVMTYGLEAAALTPERCDVNPDQVYQERSGLMRTFETVLVDRYVKAREAGNQAEMDMILAAAHQFGLYAVYEA